jgi:ABC-type cobalamin/Fe3+-siderophores transport system ATPase subunit
MLVATDVSLQYENFRLATLSLTVKPGQLVAIMGPNGAGKSSLIKLLAGLDSPVTGQITLDNRPLTQWRRRDLARQLAYVAQESSVDFPLTVLEFVLQGRFVYGSWIGWESPQDLAIAQQALALVDMTAFSKQSITTLSGGERQRVFLARALAQQPRYLLLDEPTASLDIAHQVQVFQLLRQLTHHPMTHHPTAVVPEQLAVVLITHELNLAAEFADQLLLLHQGKQIAYGPPASVMHATQLETVFGTPLLLDYHPQTGQPRVSIDRQR